MNRLELREYLQSIVDRGKYAVNTGIGLCANISAEAKGVAMDPLAFGIEVVSSNCRDWEHHSGDSVYPLPGGHTAYSKAFDQGKLWVVEQEKYRQDLCQHLINKIDNNTLVGI